jgi:hypothetical protein
MTDPSTTPGADPQIAAFARQQPGWQVWRAASLILHARLAAHPEVHVRGEDFADLADMIRRAEAQAEPPPPAPPDDRHRKYMAAAQVEDGDLGARLANIRRRLDSGESGVVEGAREQIRVLTVHLAELRRLRAKFLGSEDKEAREREISEIQELLAPGWTGRD